MINEFVIYQKASVHVIYQKASLMLPGVGRIYGKEKPAIRPYYLNLSTPHIHANNVKWHVCSYQEIKKGKRFSAAKTKYLKEKKKKKKGLKLFPSSFLNALLLASIPY